MQPAVAAAAQPAGSSAPADAPVDVRVEIAGFDAYPLVARAYPDPDDCLSWRYSDAPYAILAPGYRPDHHVLRKAVRLRAPEGEAARFAPGYASSYVFYLSSDESPELLSRLTGAIREAIAARRGMGMEKYRRCPADGRVRLSADYLGGDLRVEAAGAVAGLPAPVDARMGPPFLGDLRPLLLELDATNPSAEPAAARAFTVGGDRMHVANLVAAGGPRAPGAEHRFPVFVRGLRPGEIEWAFDGARSYAEDGLEALRRRVLCARSEYAMSRSYFGDRVEAEGHLTPVADPSCLGSSY